MMTSKRSWMTVLALGGILAASTQAQAQLGGQRGTTASNPDAQMVIVPMKHVYVGGIAQLFRGNVGTISTEQFVVPASAGQGGARGGNNRTGIMNVGGNNRGGFGGNRGGNRGGRRR